MRKLFALRSYRKQRAVFLLLAILVVIQFYFSYQKEGKNIEESLFIFDSILQQEIDSLKRSNSKQKITLFNPNDISLSKGYQLELSLEEIDRLHEFRVKGKFIKSVSDFVGVTQVSSVWVEKYRMYFKFPKLTKKIKANESIIKGQKKAINSATEKDLILVRGIGQVLSKRIVKHRNHLKGFDTLDQLHEVYGLGASVIQQLYNTYEVKKAPVRKKVALSQITLEDLVKTPYLSRSDAVQIIEFRTSRKGKINIKDLYNSLVFDSIKVKRLALYLH